MEGKLSCYCCGSLEHQFGTEVETIVDDCAGDQSSFRIGKRLPALQIHYGPCDDHAVRKRVISETSMPVWRVLE